MGILVVGSVAIDSVKTPFGERKSALGGSATYFSIAASFFNRVEIVATVGEDFPSRYIELFKKRNVGIKGLHVVRGKTFRWEGKYEGDLNSATTIATHLNVFKDFKPRIPPDLARSEFLFLANIDPDLQHSVLKQMPKIRFVACDSMNYWIATKRRALVRFLHKVDLLLLNDAEARLLTGESNLVKAADAALSFGPRAVVIKKGEHGAIYFSKNGYFVAPAYLLKDVKDPTGAGDTFAGGMMGSLSVARRLDDASLRKAIVYGSVLASFAVEDFSVGRLVAVKRRDIERRFAHFREITRF